MFGLFLSSSLYIGARDIDKRKAEASEAAKETGRAVEDTGLGKKLLKSGRVTESELKKYHKEATAPPQRLWAWKSSSTPTIHTFKETTRGEC